MVPSDMSPTNLGLATDQLKLLFELVGDRSVTVPKPISNQLQQLRPYVRRKSDLPLYIGQIFQTVLQWDVNKDTCSSIHKSILVELLGFLSMVIRYDHGWYSIFLY